MRLFSFRWNEFESNIRESFRKIRDDQRLFDVTLVTEDGLEIKAHKIILAAGSSFFRDVFFRNDHSNMYIVMKGVSRSELVQVTDFLYNGEVSINQEDMKQFIETAKSLQINGLQQDLEEEEEEELEPRHDTTKKEYGISDASQDDGVNQEGSFSDTLHDASDVDNTRMNTNSEIYNKIEEMIEKKEDRRWKCTVCGKITTQKYHIQRHAETHIEGLSYNCNSCTKSCSTKQYLQQHISNNHSGVFSCNICMKQGMNRKGYYFHNKKYHSKLSMKK